jgi:hypothetical protein
MEKTMPRNNRWSDHDKYCGPFTYARNRSGYKPLAIILSSGDGDESPACSLRISGFGHTIIAEIPEIIKPWQKSRISAYNGQLLTDTARKQYGVSSNEGFFQLFYGPQTGDSETTKSYSKFLPWMNWRHTRWSVYGLNGEHIATVPQDKGTQGYDAWHDAREDCPKRKFLFKDYDGQEIIATTAIHEGEWKFGEGWFKWLSLFRKSKIVRSLDLFFSEETGRRKGSWKGGTIGTSINMLPGELHQVAFQRYCQQNNMTFVKELHE